MMGGGGGGVHCHVHRGLSVIGGLDYILEWINGMDYWNGL